MIFKLALLSAVGVALCNGTAAVLEKISADKHARVKSLPISLLAKLVSDWPYLVGILLDLVAWPLTLIAVHTLPLYVVQPIVALSVVVTFMIEKVILRRTIPLKHLISISVILLGLVLLSLNASTEKAHPVSSLIKWLIVFAPLALAGLGSVFAKSMSNYSSALLAAIGGIAFGGTAITGRMLVLSHPYIHVLISPILWSLVAYGLVGILAFTVALQRHHASIVNTTMVAFETVMPIIIGITLLGDSPKNNQWPLVIFSIILTLSGTLIISLSAKDKTINA